MKKPRLQQRGERRIAAALRIALAAALLELAAAPDARAQMGARARAVAEEQFDRPHAYRKTVELIDRLIEER